jgi:hypothetical protein
MPTDEQLDIQDIKTLYPFDANCDEHCNRRHLQHLLEGYRAHIAGNQETCPYSPGGARDISFQEGRQLAKADMAHYRARTDQHGTWETE